MCVLFPSSATIGAFRNQSSHWELNLYHFSTSCKAFWVIWVRHGSEACAGPLIPPGVCLAVVDALPITRRYNRLRVKARAKIISANYLSSLPSHHLIHKLPTGPCKVWVAQELLTWGKVGDGEREREREREKSKSGLHWEPNS